MGNPGSNTEDCFREFIGQRLIGVMLGKLYPGHGGDLSGVLVFEDGRGLGFYTSGSYYVVPAKDIQRAAEHRRQDLEKTRQDMKHIIELMGKMPSEDRPKGKGKRKA